MRQHHRLTAVLVAVLFLWQESGPQLSAQQGPPPTPQQLDQLLSPIALYPDSLLSQIMTASTNPQEILDVDNWLASNRLSGTTLTDAAQQQGFDPAFIALVNFPQVLDMMAQNIDDYAAIGQAFMQNQGAVSDSIQRLRSQAYAAGSLRTNAQQTVQVQQPGPSQTIVIQPANPQVVFVPQYDPTVVYAPPVSGVMMAAPLITFGAGIALGALLVSRPWGWGGWGWNWGSRRAFFNHAAWGGWGGRVYRSPSPWFRPRPVAWNQRPGFGGNWRFRPANYRAPMLGSRPGLGRQPWGPNNRPGVRAGGNRFASSPRAGAFGSNSTASRLNQSRSGSFRPNLTSPRLNQTRQGNSTSSRFNQSRPGTSRTTPSRNPTKPGTSRTNSTPSRSNQNRFGATRSSPTPSRSNQNRTGSSTPSRPNQSRTGGARSNSTPSRSNQNSRPSQPRGRPSSNGPPSR